jgi:hypothetical protein
MHKTVPLLFGKSILYSTDSNSHRCKEVQKPVLNEARPAMVSIKESGFVFKIEQYKLLLNHFKDE